MGAEIKKFKLRIKQGEPTLVTPAVDTPKGFYYLSHIDQDFGFFVEHVYCYRSLERGNEEAAKVLKESLAKVLVHYYPLAGRGAINDEGRLSINCTADGAVFLEAEADCKLEDIGEIRKVDQMQLAKLVYKISDIDDMLDKPLLAAQVTKFKCGGFILGLTIHHSMVDGFGYVQFVVSWGEMAQGLPVTVPPFLSRAIMQPSKLPAIKFPHIEFTKIEDISNMKILYKQEVQQRFFHFDQVKLESIKKKTLEDNNVEKCTRFEALSGFIWKARTKALNTHPNQEIKISIAVDCRKFFTPPLPKGYIGHVTWDATSLTTAGELLNKPLSFAVGLIQKAIKMINYEYLRSAIDYMEVKRPETYVTSTSTTLITNLTWMHYNTKDFGWGAPLQFGYVTLEPKELIVFMPHGNENENIDVLIGLPGSAMKTFSELIKLKKAQKNKAILSML